MPFTRFLPCGQVARKVPDEVFKRLSNLSEQRIVAFPPHPPPSVVPLSRKGKRTYRGRLFQILRRHALYYIIDAAPCGSHPTSTGSVPEKCYRISPDLYYTISVEGELAVPRSGRRSIRPTANFSKPRDTSHRLSSNIKPLSALYHKRCPMPVLIYVYRPCFQNSCRISPPPVLIIVIEGKWMMPRNGGRNPRPTGPKIPPRHRISQHIRPCKYIPLPVLE